VIPPIPHSPIKIIGICGSLNANGATRQALKVALDGAAEFGAEVSLLELRDLDLVIFGSVATSEYPADVVALREKIRESQGIILATPEYHGSISGVLKNMLDLMDIDDFETKIIGLIGVAGGHTGAINSLNTMKTICRNLHCWVLPQDVSIANSATAFDDGGNASDPALEERLLNVGRQAMKFASLQKKVQQDDFMAMWKTLPTW
jgi:NAD(P)H-dependent FMN reductase